MRMYAIAAFAAATLVGAPANAMGRYVDLHLVAWNTDGTAALFTRTESSSGTAGMTQELILVGLRETDTLTVSFDDTQDPDQRQQKVDRATCERNAATLRRRLTAARFRGVAIRAGHCRTDRQVVSIAPLTSQALEASRIPDLSTVRPTTARELAIESTVIAALGEFPEGAEVASIDGALVVVLSGVNGDESGPAHALVIARTPTGAALLGDDLRR